jgi:hypothetical protein
MSGQSQGPSPWLSLFGARAAGGETTTRETLQVSPETKVKIQVYQALTLLVSIPVTGIGAWATVKGVADLLDMDILGMDALLGAVMLFVLAAALYSVSRSITSSTASLAVRSIFYVLLIAIVVGIILFAYAREDEVDGATKLKLLLGPAAMYAGGLLTYNMTVHLRDPFGFKSPFETRFMDWLDRKFLEEEDAPGQPPSVQVLEVRTENGAYLGDSKTLGMEADTLRKFSTALEVADWDLTESRWAKGTFFETYTAYRAFRSSATSLGLVRRVGSGFEITPRGRSFFRRIAAGHKVST